VTRTTQRVLALGGVALLAVFVAIQFVPVARRNAVGSGDPRATREVQSILRRACYDCHSMESRWPIWAYVAPASWRVVDDVERARKVVNFSEWPRYTTAEQRAIKQTIAFSTKTHRMPTWYYLTLHPDAKLSREDLSALLTWATDTTPELSRGP
jgi:hypothetical protein